MRLITVTSIITLSTLLASCTGSGITSGGTSSTSSPNATTYNGANANSNSMLNNNQRAATLQHSSSTDNAQDVKATPGAPAFKIAK